MCDMAHPAGLIASQNLAAEQTGINQAIDNANRANNVIGTASGGLNEVSNLLNQLDGLVNQSANTGGLSTAEIARLMPSRSPRRAIGSSR